MIWADRQYTDFDLVRVNGATMEEIDLIDGIAVEGSITHNLNTSLKQAGSLTALKHVDFGNDLIRIYANVKDIHGSTARVALATLLAVTPIRKVDGSSISGDIDLLSTLQIVSDDAIDGVLTIPAGTSTVPYAANLARSTGVNVISEDSDSKLTTDWTYDAGTSKLTIVNELLDYANFFSADVNGMGIVNFRRYHNPIDSTPIHTFKDDEASILIAGSISSEFDWYDTPNKVICLVSDPERYMVATATNDNPQSPFSTLSRGRVISRTEEFHDIETQADLQARADMLLAASTRNSISIEFSHAYVPLSLGDVVRLNHELSGIDLTGSVQQMNLSLSVDMHTTTRIRRFV